MKIIIAIDSFKGSMTSLQAGNAAAQGIKRYLPDADIRVKPIADGGEGTVEALVEGLNGSLRTVRVKNPLGHEIDAQYGIIGTTAVIEMACAAGLALISKEQLDPMETTTYGVGELIRDAVISGCRNFIIGIGGSATNDGGVGMLQALGFEFLDQQGKSVAFGAKALGTIRQIRDEQVMPELKECTFHIACDVTNPLCGENGCSAIFGPQKGAKQEDIPVMDAGMRNYAEVTARYNPRADQQAPGAGAAGGLGFAFMAYLNGNLQSGIELILEQIRMEEEFRDADLIITGEGRIDAQTVMGKAPVGIAALAKKYGKPVLAFAGSVTRDAAVCNRHGIDAIFPIVRGVCTLDEAMDTETACANLADCAEQAVRLWCLNQK